MTGPEESTCDVPAPPFPPIVNVEVLRGECPCRCVHCPVGITPPGERETRFGRGSMPGPRFERIVNELSQHPESILRVHATGEPLLWPELAAALESCRRASVRSWLFTSAVVEDDALIRAIGQTAAIVEVSINSVDSVDYLRTKGVPGFDLARRNLALLADEMQMRSGGRLLASRVESEDLGADRAFVEHWRASGLVHDAFVRSFHSYNGLLGDLEQAPSPPERSASAGACLVHRARFNLDVDGRALVCFNEVFNDERDRSLVLGNIDASTIEEIWRGPLLHRIRAADAAGKLDLLPYSDRIPCVHCRYRQVVGARQTSEHQVQALGDNNINVNVPVR